MWACGWGLPSTPSPVLDTCAPRMYTASVYNWMSLEPHFLAHCSGTSCVGGPFRGAVYRASASQRTLRVHTSSVQVRERYRIDEPGAQVGLVHITVEHCRWVLPLCLPPQQHTLRVHCVCVQLDEPGAAFSCTLLGHFLRGRPISRSSVPSIGLPVHLACTHEQCTSTRAV